MRISGKYPKGLYGKSDELEGPFPAGHETVYSHISQFLQFRIVPDWFPELLGRRCDIQNIIGNLESQPRALSI